MTNPFAVLGRFFKKLFRLPGIAVTADKALEEVESHLPAALQVVQEIEALVPNHYAEEVLALGRQFGLEPPVHYTKLEVESMLQNIAVLKMKEIAATTSHHILRSAINLAVSLMKGAKGR